MPQGLLFLVTGASAKDHQPLLPANCTPEGDDTLKPACHPSLLPLVPRRLNK